MCTHLRTELVAEALEMALARRKPEDVIHHSDQGCHYTSIEFGRRCREGHVRPSMGTVGEYFDNAICESSLATLECELLDRRTFRTQVEARMSVPSHIEGFYNHRRRRSAIGNLSPMRCEVCHGDAIAAGELDSTPRFRGTEGLVEPLQGSPTSPQPAV
ncbi:MAG: DDE-type integrase/transposase/recombinase [Thermoanaerobaculia bacterium]|jgi:putative transposase|nr:DDE-type integrase/transposase/recombinase [Thermoanaerobaculia bacterium]MBP9824605.1 DDE-type integrase/transposase/recombinase [Thermoanaerobaculia bacterium]